MRAAPGGGAGRVPAGVPLRRRRYRRGRPRHRAPAGGRRRSQLDRLLRRERHRSRRGRPRGRRLRRAGCPHRRRRTSRSTCLTSPSTSPATARAGACNGSRRRFRPARSSRSAPSRSRGPTGFSRRCWRWRATAARWRRRPGKPSSQPGGRGPAGRGRSADSPGQGRLRRDARRSRTRGETRPTSRSSSLRTRSSVPAPPCRSRTHDPVIREALLPALAGAVVEMLLGVRSQDQIALAARGIAVRVYVPYGDRWFRYAMRRAAESRGAR